MLNLEYLLYVGPIFLMAISFHEFAHAWMAVRCGDLTPQVEGRLTLDFTKHLSLVGTLMLFLIGIGWAKPVNVNPHNFRNPRLDMMRVALAGPVSNVLLAVVFAFLIRLQPVYFPLLPVKLHTLLVIQNFLLIGVRLNILLAIFNMIPIPPLDGSKIIAPFLPRRWNYSLESLAPYGFLLIFLFFRSGFGGLISNLTHVVTRFLVS